MCFGLPDKQGTKISSAKSSDSVGCVSRLSRQERHCNPKVNSKWHTNRALSWQLHRLRSSWCFVTSQFAGERLYHRRWETTLDLETR